MILLRKNLLILFNAFIAQRFLMENKDNKNEEFLFKERTGVY